MLHLAKESPISRPQNMYQGVEVESLIRHMSDTMSYGVLWCLTGRKVSNGVWRLCMTYVKYGVSDHMGKRNCLFCLLPLQTTFTLSCLVVDPIWRSESPFQEPGVAFLEGRVSIVQDYIITSFWIHSSWIFLKLVML